MVLETLFVEDKGAVDLLAKAFAQRDALWLQSARDMGLFRFEADAKALAEMFSVASPTHIEGDPIDAADRGSEKDIRSQLMLRAFTPLLGLFSAVECETAEIDERYGELRQPLEIPCVPADESFRAVFTNIVDDFVEDGARYKESVRAIAAARDGGGFDVSNQAGYTAMLTTAAALMVGACALNDPAAVAKIVLVFPRAVDRQLDPNYFAGAAWVAGFQKARSLARSSDGAAFFVPAAYAMHYSATKCLDALVEAGWKPASRIGSWVHGDLTQYGIENNPDPMRSWDPQTRLHGLTIVDLLREDAFAGLPSTLFCALEHFKEWGELPKLSRRDLFEAAMARMGPDCRVGLLPAYLEAGALDMDIGGAIRTSMEVQLTEVLTHYRDRLPWDELANDGEVESALQQMLEGCGMKTVREEGDSVSPFESLAIDFLRMAKEDGVIDAFSALRPTPSWEGRSKPPRGIDVVSSAIDNGMGRLVGVLIEAGMNPNGKVQGVDKTPLEMMEEQGRHDMLSTARSLVARRHAEMAIAGIVAQAGRGVQTQPDPSEVRSSKKAYTPM